jgi:RHS repeat-associated protein
MSCAGRWLAVCLGCCAIGLAGAPVAFGAGSSAEGASAEASPAGEGGGASSLGSSLVTLGSPTQGEQAQAAEQAKLASPEAVAAREESQSKYEGLDPGQAAKLAGEAFPGTIDRPAGTLPQLPAGQQVVGYPADNAAQVDLGEGKHGVIESMEPIAIETSPEHHEPLDLGLSEANGVFQPTRSDVALRIPKQLAEGVQLAGAGISLTPVGANGSALGGAEGKVDGVTVLYANTQTDADTVVKPLTSGFEEDTLLRSVNSPQQLSFRLGLPEGATLRQATAGSGPVEVVKEGQALALVPSPSAEDAAGTPVPVSMSVTGDILTLSVDEHAGEYELPIDVDPTVEDKELLEAERDGANGNWIFESDSKGLTSFGWCDPICRGDGFGIEHNYYNTYDYEPGQDAFWEYSTQGKSHIYEFFAKTEVGKTSSIDVGLRIASPAKGKEGSEVAPGGGTTENKVCVSACSPEAVTEENKHNSAFFELYALEKGGGEGPADSVRPVSFVDIEQEAGPSVAGFDTTEEVVNGEQNALYGNRWASTTTGKWGLKATATDPGLGVSKEIWSSPNASKWGASSQVAGCEGAQCDESVSVSSPLKGKGTETLPEGEDTVEVKAEDPLGLTATKSTKVKVDNAPPHSVTLSGLPSTHEISDGQHFLLKASATSGLAGMASIVLTMDGQEIGTASKGCSPGECTASGEWTLSGESYAAGAYTLAVIATDNADNVTTEDYTVTIHHASDISVGPGSVSPTTGELGLSATDVSVGAPGATLTVGRSYRSRHMGVEAESPLGAQWGLSIGGSESLSRTSSGSMVLTSSSGQQSVFASNGKGGYTSPPGDAGLTLSEKIVGKVTDFLLSENGSVTTFAVPSGGSGGLWEPSISEGAGGTNAVTFAYKTEGGVTEPTEDLAPVPSGVSCSPTLSKGCRALKFVYATKTKESIGEGPSQWGEYKGRLLEVTFTAYEPASKEMKTKAVAKYAYDSKGRLRAEWNPQITPELKTVYGYDGEGHVTALAPAGQQPWLFEQGTTASDAAPGRVLAIARPAATTEAILKTEMEASVPVNMVAPTLSSTTPTVGVKLGVNLTSEKTPGTWSNSPLAYSYKWEDCNTAGKECTAIPGAVNQSYYPVSSDEGHTLAAEVVALNADGSGTASSAATGVVAAGTPSTQLPEPPLVGSLSVWTLDYLVPLSGTEAGLPKMSSTEVAKWGQTDVPAEAMAVFPPDKPMGWPAKEYTRASIYYLDGRDRSVNVSSPTGGISTTEYNLYNDVTRTLSPDNRATALAAGEEKSKALSKELDNESTYEEKSAEPGTELLSTLGPKHTVELTNGTKAEAREHTVYSYNVGAPEGGGPYHLVTTTTEGAQIAGTEEAASVQTTKTSYSGQNNLGWKLRKPTSVTAAPTGLKLTHSIFYEPKTGSVTETRMPAAGAPGEEQGDVFSLQFGKVGSENGQLKEPQGIAVNSTDEYVLDTGNSRVEEFNRKGVAVETISYAGKGELKEPKGIALDSKGDVWVANTGDNALDEYASGGYYETDITNGLKAPQGIAVGAEGTLWVANTGDNKITKLIYNEEYEEVEKSSSFGTEGTGATQFKEPQDIAIGAEGDLYITDTGNNRIEELSSSGTFIRTMGWGVSNGKAEYEICTKECKAGIAGSGNGQLKAPHGITTDSAGDVWVTDSGNNRIEEFGPAGTYIQTFGKEGTTEGKLKSPKGIAIDAEGDAWVADTANNNVQEWTPAGASGYGSGTASAHDTQTIYYTAGVNTKVTSCGEHPEWANLPCQTQPAAQPEGELPKLQVTTYTYNIWDEPETTTNTSGTTTRTTTETYDSAGRLKTTATSSTVGKALPTITDKYSEALGALEEQSNEGKTKPIVSHYNTLGQLTSYTDAAESTTTYEYDVDGRIKKTNDGKGVETYTYSATTGLPTELLNEYGTTKLAFTGTYDVEGNLLTEGYPNGMTATYTFNQVGKPTSLVYKKITNCTEEEKEKCKWFKDTIVPSIHGQWLEQTSTLSHQAYTYDAAGRLTQVQNTPSEKGCTTRVYTYEEDTNRTSLTTHEPGTEGKCTTEGAGSEEKHTYDTADRLTDAGVSYNVFGDITALPDTDVGGKEASEGLTSEYYVDNQLASQKQGEQTIGYNLDPTGRTIETVAAGKRAETVTNHYAGPGDTPAWTSNTSGETTREIPGITGALTATQSNLADPVLQLTNLHGDIIATAFLSETATGLASETDTSEYGVPTTSLPPKYSWLGADEIPTELPSGVLDMGARSYVPQLGRFLQPDPIEGGSANAYSYTFGDPVNTSDPSGEYTATIENWAREESSQIATSAADARQAEIAAQQAAQLAAEEAIARREAEGAAEEASWAAWWAGYDAGLSAGSYGGEEEWGEEEGGEEEVAFHPGVGKQGSPLVEEGLMFQPENAVEGSGMQKHLITMCVVHSKSVGHPCLRTVSIFSEAVHFVKHAAKSAWHKFRKIVHYIINARDKAEDGIAPYSNNQTANGCEVVGFLTTFGSPFAKVGASVAFTVGATIWASC